MKYNQLTVNTNRSSRRVGRGIAAGRGKTAGRGTKGQNARGGSKARPGFEGGQNPLFMRLPKLPGFRSIRIKDEIVYTGQLDQLSPGIIDNFTLASSGITSSPHVRVKLIVKGEVHNKVNVRLQSASESAKAAVQKTGGKFEAVPRVPRPSKKAPA